MVVGSILILALTLITFDSAIAAPENGKNKNNASPTISGTPPTSVLVGQTYVYRPTATDAEGDPLVFKIRNRPAWASFDSASGELRGTTDGACVGTYSDIVISVSDGRSWIASPAFSVTVESTAQRVNQPPSIGGTPAPTVLAGQSYSFTPTASDADGDVLTFSIQNRPAWAAFSPSTGRLSGTPGESNVGYNYNIVISVSDGTASANLPAFTIKVEQPVTASVTLSWQAPTSNEDGTPLTDLAGYQVHYGQVSGQYLQTLSLPDAAFTSVTIEDLTPATWYFAVKAVNSAGVVSSFSNEAWKSIN